MIRAATSLTLDTSLDFVKAGKEASCAIPDLSESGSRLPDRRNLRLACNQRQHTRQVAASSTGLRTLLEWWDVYNYGGEAHDSDARGDRFRYRSGGLTIAADRPLPGLVVDQSGHGIALDLSAGSRRSVPGVVPPGRRLVDPDEERKSRLGVVRDGDGYLVRFFSQCDVRISADLGRATYFRDPGANDLLVDQLMAGTLLAVVLALRGTCVLPASAVDVRGRALGFVGHSGMGKSTLALATCAAGARLISEDVLAVTAAAQPTCLAGNAEIRLRRKSASLAERLEGAELTRTVDGRQAVRPQRTQLDAVPLDTLVVPRPSRRAQRLTVQEMPRAEALFRLIAFPRLHGLKDPNIARVQFEVIGRIVRSVPVLLVTVPWGPPFMEDLGEQLLALMTNDSRR